MSIDISFKEVCKFIKEDDPKLINNVDVLLGLLLILAPMTVIPASIVVAPALGLLTVKNELTKLGKELFEKLTKKKDNDIVSRQRRMEVAYGLICYTAFFDAVDHLLPEFKKELGLGPYEKFELSKSALARLEKKNESRSLATELDASGLLSLRIALPHPAETFEQQCQNLQLLYKELTDGFLSFLEGLAFWEQASGLKKENIMYAALQLPKLSLKYFRAQYFLLATKYEDFFIWSNLQEHKEIRVQLDKLSTYLQKHIALTESANRNVDVGLAEMGELINTIPDRIEVREVNKVLNELNRFYSSKISQPVIREQFDEKTSAPALSYPKKSEIFVPQSFKVLKYAGSDLSEEETWKNTRSRNDLGAFLLSYLSSPYSMYTPLIILGHPGSGKSLLTEILSAKLISPLYTPIRIELREVVADSDITTQVEEQIRKDLGRSIKWANLVEQLGDRPGLILLDGYDELLQSSGQVISTYIMKVQNLQEREMAIRHPIRAFITSRVTLINKAQIPVGATVIRLDEFNDVKRRKWISIWNTANKSYFAQTKVEPFLLHPNNEKVLQLAEHPLLLLMLAIYDSDQNSLRKNSDIDRTLLYDSLLRRFIERELLKDEKFVCLGEKERNEDIEIAMERLGVVAISMFNRKRLYISGAPLSADLEFFGLKRAVNENHSRKLSPVDYLVGSFFFILESRAVQKVIGSDERTIESTIEFLHNTFGEFLTADFIIRQVLREITLTPIKANPDWRGVQIDTELDSNLQQARWYASLMYTPLHTRSVILDMIREWYNHKLKMKGIVHNDFLLAFDRMMIDQLRGVLTSDDVPLVMIKYNKPIPDQPLIGLLATYTLNLIVLRTTWSSEGFDFDEEKFPLKTGTRLWDRLANLWRSWFTMQSLISLSSVIESQRRGTIIHIKKPKESLYGFADKRVESARKVSNALADETIQDLVLKLIQTGHYTWH